jgi:hypothetical protein
MCMLDGRRIMAFGALGGWRFYVYDVDGTCARMRCGFRRIVGEFLSISI